MPGVELKNLTYNIDFDEVIFTTLVEVDSLKIVGFFTLPRAMLATLYQRALKIKRNSEKTKKEVNDGI